MISIRSSDEWKDGQTNDEFSVVCSQELISKDKTLSPSFVYTRIETQQIVITKYIFFQLIQYTYSYLFFRYTHLIRCYIII